MRTTNPISLKTVLRAEVTVLHAHLQACWASQSPWLVFAIIPQALLVHHYGRIFEWIRSLE
jgi:hypothetical protein